MNKFRKINLSKLDFSQNESLVYDILTSGGPSSAGNIISKSNLHRNVVYTALDHLVYRKIVVMKKINGIMVFEAILPDILLQEVKEKEKYASALVDYYHALNSNKDIQEISVHEGNEEYLRLLSVLVQSMPKKSTKYVMGTGGEEFMENTMRPIWKEYHNEIKKQRLSIKMLAYSSQKRSLDPDISGLDMYQIKYIKSDTPNPAGIHIYPEIDTVLNIIYSTKFSPVTAIRIRNKALTRAYLNLFNTLWRKW